MAMDNSPGGSWRGRGLAWAVVAILLLWLGGFLQFTSQLPRQMTPRPMVSDAIVVLTGGRGRLPVGLQLLTANKGRRLLISGVKAGVTAAELQPDPVAEKLFSCCVDLGYQAHDTPGNANEAAIWMQRHGYESLHLVTASYHMPRSLLLFQQTMPDVTLRPHPVFPKHVKLARWWLFPGTLKLLAVEYSKYLVSLIGVRLAHVSF